MTSAEQSQQKGAFRLNIRNVSLNNGHFHADITVSVWFISKEFTVDIIFVHENTEPPKN